MAESKVRASEILTQLLNHPNAADPKRKLALQKLQRTLTTITIISSDLISLYPEILKCLQSTTGDKIDVQVLKWCYNYIQVIGVNDLDNLMEVLPILIDRLTNGSEIVQLMTLRLMVGIPVKEYVRHCIQISRSIIEKTAGSGGGVKLRTLAVYSVARLFEIDDVAVSKAGLLSLTYDALEDPQPAVALAAVTVLNELNDNVKLETPLRFDFNQALWLLELLDKVEEFGKVQVLTALLNFVPQRSTESLAVIDKVASLLMDANSSIVLNCFKLILYCLNYVDAIPQGGNLLVKMTNSISALLSNPSPEIQFLTLRNVILLTLSKPLLFHFDVSLFFCSFDDTAYVKDTKLEIIYLLASESNISIILSELGQYASDVDVGMSRKAVRAIGNLAVKFNSSADEAVDLLMELLSYDVDYVNQEVILVMKNVFRRHDAYQRQCLPLILQRAHRITDPESKSALIWIIGTHSDAVPDAELLLSDLTSQFSQDPVDLQLTSLTSVMKLHLNNYKSQGAAAAAAPPPTTTITVSLLQKATKSIENPDVRDRAYFYLRLLKLPDQSIANDIVNGEIPFISTDNEKLDPRILEELQLNIGTLASIYLKPVGSVFRLAKRKVLTNSHARTNALEEYQHDDQQPQQRPSTANGITSASSSGEDSRSRSQTANSSNTSLSYHSNNNNNNNGGNNTEAGGNGAFRNQDDFDVDSLRKPPMKKSNSGLSNGSGNSSAGKLGRKLSSVGRKFSLRR